ncbi:MAG: peptidylprolyl isomerase [Chloracidobacterium sp.]|nr:peptidylprolyl isomerase [Chloracidobacterium sp.]
MLKTAVLLSAVAASSAMITMAQAPTPGVKKVNDRPPDKTTTTIEPYDRADVRSMAGKCVTFDTESGMIEIELYPEHALESVRNFLNLTALGLFDTTTFSRVVPGFVIQGGNVWTRAGAVTHTVGMRARRTVPDEPNRILHERGVVSMARGDEANTATTNFFILVDKASYLDGKFAAFGRVIKGMDIVDTINKAPVTGEKPDKPVRILKATVAECSTKAP